MEFHFLFPGLEKSWNLTLGFGKLIKVMEIIRHPLIKPHGSFCLLNPAHHHRNIDMSSVKIKIDLVFFITFCLNWLQIIQGLACHIPPPCLGTCIFHAISYVKNHCIFSLSHGKVMEKLLPFSGYTLIVIIYREHLSILWEKRKVKNMHPFSFFVNDSLKMVMRAFCGK